MENNHWLIYGATGYTGKRIAERAVALGYAPVLAGRNNTEIKKLAALLKLEYRCFDLQHADTIEQHLDGISTLLNCAGPFIDTVKPLLAACLNTATHYLDITGEVGVYELLADWQQQAIDAGIMLLPGTGFDMVPGDCLALQLLQQLPDACELEVAYLFDGTLTRGSLRSALSAFGPFPKIRRNHQLIELNEPLSKNFNFANQPDELLCHAMTFGDISLGWRTTQIANITSWIHLSPAFQQLAGLSEETINTLPEGPCEKELATHRACITATARNSQGESRSAQMVTPQVYAITFALAADIAERVHSGQFETGFVTPAGLFGADFIKQFDGCRIQFID